jgi:hypothetical protein
MRVRSLMTLRLLQSTDSHISVCELIGCGFSLFSSGWRPIIVWDRTRDPDFDGMSGGPSAI